MPEPVGFHLRLMPGAQSPRDLRIASFPFTADSPFGSSTPSSAKQVTYPSQPFSAVAFWHSASSLSRTEESAFLACAGVATPETNTNRARINRTTTGLDFIVILSQQKRRNSTA